MTNETISLAMPLPSIILPGYLAGSADYKPMAMTLEHLGFPTAVVPLQWWEWLPTVGGRSIAPILEKLDRAITDLQKQHNASQVNIIAHSAGGWISRIYLGDRPYYQKIWHGRSKVARLVSLGTPHRSLEPWTVKNLGFVNETYPQAFYGDITYVCVAGKAVFGDRTFKNWIAYNSYALTCGTGATWGDGITPIQAAHLLGATNLTLDGVHHSPRSGVWYGSEPIIREWAAFL